VSKLIIDLEFLKKLKRDNPVYFRKVVAAGRGYSSSTVVFGTTGSGASPNYEVTLPNDVKLPKNGITHKPFTFDKDLPKDERQFNSDNVSDSFTIAVLDSL
jgi:hypothetical protein